MSRMMTMRESPWGSLKSNHYWGSKSGTVHPQHGPCFPLKRMGAGKSGNHGPLGWKLRRAPRSYSNAKLRRLGRGEIGLVGRARRH